MNILIAIVIGGFVGWIASKLMNTGNQTGVIANVAVGIVGSWLGSWLAPRLGLVPQDGLGRFLVGVGGAVLLIWILKALNVFK